MLASRARLLVAVLWVGAIWTIGYVVAPTLFATLQDRTLAGTIAASMFRNEAYLSFICGVLLLVLLVAFAPDYSVGERRKIFILIGAMLACTAINQLGLQPYMAELRAAAGGIVSGDAKTQFGILHGVSSIIYLIKSLLGVGLILSIR